MMRALLLVSLLGACAASPLVQGPVSAREVTLYRDTVTARMTDGAFCTAVREGRGGPWSATFRGCPHPWPVVVQRPTTQPRVPLVPTPQDPWVVVTGPGGAQGFGPLP